MESLAERPRSAGQWCGLLAFLKEFAELWVLERLDFEQPGSDSIEQPTMLGKYLRGTGSSAHDEASNLSVVPSALLLWKPLPPLT